MTITNLTNIIIQEKQDKNLNPYYLIIDKNTQEAYFCFPYTVKEGWTDLESKYQQIKEVELEYEVNERRNRKVKSIFSPEAVEFIC